jgi:hypothetical protein
MDEEGAMRTTGRWIRWAALLLVLAVPVPAGAFEVSSGVSLGGFQAGTIPRLAVSPHVSIAWRATSNYLVALHDLCSVLPPSNFAGIGIYNDASVAVGYASEKVYFSAGPSFSIYSMTACGLALCGRVVGVAAGGHAQTDVYVARTAGGLAERQCDLDRRQEPRASRRPGRDGRRRPCATMEG